MIAKSIQYFLYGAIKQLKEEQSKEITDRNEITKAHRHNLDACTKKLDALFNMRLNEEIGPEEYAKKKGIYRIFCGFPLFGKEGLGEIFQIISSPISSLMTPSIDCCID